MDGFHLAQLNIGRLHHPLDSEETAEFDAALADLLAVVRAARLSRDRQGKRLSRLLDEFS